MSGVFSPLSITGFGGFARNAVPEYWSRVVAAADLARDSATARLIDPEVAIAMVLGATYLVRGIYYWTAEAGGPSLVHRLNGPAFALLNIDRGIAAGAQATVSLNQGHSCVMAYDTVNVSTIWNTGGPAQAFGLVTIEGYVTTTAAGTFGLEWTSSSALWALTRRKGSYLEYRKL